MVREVSDEEILDAKAQVGAGGLGCEPASAASVAGAKRLLAEGVIGPDQRVVCILTGHQLKDPTATVAYHTADQRQFAQVLGSRGVRRAAFANRPVAVANDLEEIIKAITTASARSTQRPRTQSGGFANPWPLTPDTLDPNPSHELPFALPFTGLPAAWAGGWSP